MKDNREMLRIPSTFPDEELLQNNEIDLGYYVESDGYNKLYPSYVSRWGSVNTIIMLSILPTSEQ